MATTLLAIQISGPDIKFGTPGSPGFTTFPSNLKISGSDIVEG